MFFGPLPFEALAIASISVFLNILTSLALESAKGEAIDNNYLLQGLLICSFLLFIFSFYFSKKLNDIFLLTKSERGTQIDKIKGKNCSFVVLVVSFLLFIGFLIALFSFNPTTNNSERDDIAIGYQEIALYRHIFTAQEKGFFTDEGLEVQLESFASGNQMMEAFLSNHIDVLGLANTPVALTIEGKESNKLKFINFQIWKPNAFPDYIITRKSANILSIKDLEGKTVGLHPGSAVRAFSKVVFERFGLDQSKIRTIELKPDIMQSTLISGNVDAVYCMDPLATTLFLSGECDTLISNPMQYIFSAPTPISGTAIATKLSISNPELVRKFVFAIDRAIEYMREPKHEDEIAGFISKYTPIKKEQALKMNPSVYWTNNEIQPQIVQSIANKFFELGIVEKQIETQPMLLQINIE